MKICVNCRPGPRGEPEPAAFHLGGTRLPVVSVLDCWGVPRQRFYSVSVLDGRRFVLCRDAEKDSWELSAVYGPAQPAQHN